MNVYLNVQNTNDKIRLIELLAPAKNSEIGIAAINCGADAVYIGAAKFGARVSAGNSLADIETLINYAHQYYAKVYITVNTLLLDNELEETQTLIHNLWNIGADAVIIQDFGILELSLPPIPLFASTQMHNDTIDKILFLEKAGFSRVILARELTLTEIQSISKKASIELETFVHGALCVSYSGQCYFSQYMGGRSGNRGNCAQPCRNIYTLQDDKGNIISKDKHLLSIKDLNCAKYIEELILAGVSSFKIEGRLKDENYVKNCTAYYRKTIDRYLDGKAYKKSSSGLTTFGFTPNPVKTYARGFTSYMIGNEIEEIPLFDSPKSKGEYLGTVKNINGNSFTLESAAEVSAGDGICFMSETNILDGTHVIKTDGNKIFPDDISKIKKEMSIYRNYNAVFIKELKNAKTSRKIYVDVIFEETANGFQFSIIDEDGNQTDKELIIEKQIAENSEKSLETLNRQLSKFGDTMFQAESVIIKTSKNYFFRSAVLNELRRDAAVELLAVRKKNYIQTQRIKEDREYPYPLKKLDYRGNILNLKSKQFFTRHGVHEIDLALEHKNSAVKKPRLMRTKLCLKRVFKLCEKKYGGKDISNLFLVDNKGKRFELVFNCSQCEMELYPDINE